MHFVGLIVCLICDNARYEKYKIHQRTFSVFRFIKSEETEGHNPSYRNQSDGRCAELQRLYQWKYLLLLSKVIVLAIEQIESLTYLVSDFVSCSKHCKAHDLC